MIDTSSGFCIVDVRDLAEVHARLLRVGAFLLYGSDPSSEDA